MKMKMKMKMKIKMILDEDGFDLFQDVYIPSPL
jgi:hypothetical protein